MACYLNNQCIIMQNVPKQLGFITHMKGHVWLK